MSYMETSLQCNIESYRKSYSLEWHSKYIKDVRIKQLKILSDLRKLYKILKTRHIDIMRITGSLIYPNKTTYIVSDFYELKDVDKRSECWSGIHTDIAIPLSDDNKQIVKKAIESLGYKEMYLSHDITQEPVPRFAYKLFDSYWEYFIKGSNKGIRAIGIRFHDLSIRPYTFNLLQNYDEGPPEYITKDPEFIQTQGYSPNIMPVFNEQGFLTVSGLESERSKHIKKMKEQDLFQYIPKEIQESEWCSLS